MNGAYFITICTKDRFPYLSEIRTSMMFDDNNATIPALVSTFKRFVNKRIGFNIWQRSYYDHIIRGEGEFAEIWRYIENNPENHANNIFNQNLWR